MRNILITILVAFAVSAGLMLIMPGNIAFPVLIGILSAITVFVILTRKATKELERLNNKAQKALYSQKFDRALRIYESGLLLARKSPFIAGQIHGLIGMIHFMRKDNDKAKPSLIRASSMNWVAKGMLGVIYMHEKKYDEMEKAFRTMVTSGKKEGLAWALYAYCLERVKEHEKAIKILEEGNKKLKENDERIKTNILELKNNRRMRMKQFGDTWYQFMLERPPAKKMVQQQGMGNKGGFKKNALYKG
ncbi:MAG: tetratricopeptide repeat protein [Candidatus Delongbacteria bacterium]